MEAVKLNEIENSYVEDTNEFGQIRYNKTSHVDPQTHEPHYVPNFVSCITPGNEFILERAPCALRKIALHRRSWKDSQPQVLTAHGLCSIPEFLKQLRDDTYIPTLYLPPHPNVPTKPDGQVDVAAIFRANARIRNRKADIPMAEADPWYKINEQNLDDTIREIRLNQFLRRPSGDSVASWRDRVIEESRPESFTRISTS